MANNLKDRDRRINGYYSVYLFTCILFMVLSPQYFGFILPAVFLVPIYMGIKGIKFRSKKGLLFSLSIVPVGIMTAFTWIRYGIYAIYNYEEALSYVVKVSGSSIGLSKILVAGPPLLSTILLVLCILQMVKAFRIKSLFV